MYNFYLRDHPSYLEAGVIKLGITDNLANRESVYKTSEYELGRYALVVEFYSDTPKQIDDFAKFYFKTMHRIANGGTEFYSREIILAFPEFLEHAENQFGTQFSIINSDDYNLTRKHRDRVPKIISEYVDPIKYSSVSNHRCTVNDNSTTNLSRDRIRLEIIKMEEELYNSLNDPILGYNPTQNPPIYIIKQIKNILVFRAKNKFIAHTIIPIKNTYYKFTIIPSESMLCWCEYSP